MKKNLKSSLFDKNTVLERTSLNACQGGVDTPESLISDTGLLFLDTGFASDMGTTYNPLLDFPTGIENVFLSVNN